VHRRAHYFFITIWAVHFFTASALFAQQTPFHGSPLPIPGRIEAEDFDKGGEGVAYHDEDSKNTGGKYRLSEGVDIETSTEGDYNIGWIRPGEWTEYTVDIKQSGLYRIDMRTASSSQSGVFHLELDGENFTGSQQTPVTGGWQTWETMSLNEVFLSAGEKVLRWYAETIGFNVNYFDFSLLASSEPPTVALTSPADKADFIAGDPIVINVAASDPDGYVVKVAFLANDAVIGEDQSAPFSLTWRPSQADKYDLIAVAYDDKGVSAASEKVDITVHFPDYAEGPNFSAAHGFYETAFDLTISSSLPGAKIKYTVDCSDPTSSSTAKLASSPAKVHVNPASTVGRGNTPAFVVRAVAVNGAAQLTRVKTNTYIFIEKVKTQRRPSNWPGSEINGQRLKYDVNRSVVNSADYKNLIDDALLQIPTISISTDMDNLFDPAIGIYVNATEHGSEWERPTSVELINPSGEAGFQVDAGLRIRGGWHRNDSNPKHSFRLFFREAYGYAKLKYPMFEDEGVDEFDKIDLRCSQNYSWASDNSTLNTENRDVFSRDVQREMQQAYTRSRYYHLYVDGLYWGLYETQERSEASYAAFYFGGSKSDYDVVKTDAGYGRPYTIEATDGNLGGWYKVWQACENGFDDADDYFRLQGKKADGSPDPNGVNLVDVDNLIDYMITIFHTGNYDAPVSKFSGNKNPNNFYAVYNRSDDKGFIFFCHDNEHTLLIDPVNVGDGIDEDRVTIADQSGDRKMVVNSFTKFHPQWLHYKLSENKEYRQKFADHVYKHYFNNGILVPQNSSALFMQRANMIDMAIIAESARWGNLTLSKNNAWLPTVTEIADSYFGERRDIVMRQYLDAGLYPTIDPPLFKSDNAQVTQTILTVTPGHKVDIENSNGTQGDIYYTMDGSDPRQVGGAVAKTAIKAGDKTQTAINGTTVLNARVKSGAQWSALQQVSFYVPTDAGSIKITEILYKPIPKGEISGREFEFVEFKNTGHQPVDLSMAALVKGVQYTFPPATTVPAGAFLVFASNSQRFEERYAFAPFDEFVGQLDNSGEKLVLLNAVGDTLISVRYNDKAPWPEEPDSLGKSLVPVQINPTGNPDDPSYWQASRWVNGSPGRDDKATTAVSTDQNAPEIYALLQNYPNPFNSSTTIDFTLAKTSFATLKIFDIRGRQVKVVLAENLAAGRHKITWDAGDVAAGVYFYSLETNRGARLIRKLVYVK